MVDDSGAFPHSVSPGTSIDRVVAPSPVGKVAYVTRFLTRILGREDWAREAVDATAEILIGSSREPKSTSLAAWTSVAIDMAIARLRRSRLSADSDDAVPCQNEGMQSRAQFLMPSAQQLIVAIESLPDALRRPFVMAYVQRRPVDEIARVLEISQEELATQLAHALSHCRTRLVEFGL